VVNGTHSALPQPGSQEFESYTKQHKQTQILCYIKTYSLVHKILNEGVSTVSVTFLCKNWTKCNKKFIYRQTH
jgi:hypothetical protein